MINKGLLKNIKLVILDLDGTLLNNNGEIPQNIIEIISELQKKGVMFSIATGRLFSSVKQFSDLLGINIPLITLDGTLIKYPFENKNIYQSFITSSNVKRAITLADKYFLRIALCHPEAIYYTEENVLIPNILEKFGAKYQFVHSYDNYLLNVLEIVIAGDYKDTLRFVEKKMIFPYTFGVRTLFYKSQSHGGIYYLEIRNAGSSKGKGLKYLSKHLNVKISDIAVLGDWYNDRPLFETDALKIAVANAVPELKNMADFVTSKTNDEEGTLEFFRMLLKAKS